MSLEAAQAYDVSLSGIWSDLIGREVSVDEPRLWLPLRMGGCGASSARARMFSAPWASWSAVVDELVDHLQARDVEHLFEKAPDI